MKALELIQNNDEIKKYNAIPYENIPKIRVIIRKRPLSKKEISKNEKDVIDIKEKKKVIVKEQKQKVDLTKYVEEHQFIFDLAYNQETTNEQIYLETVRPMIEAAFNKTKVTCFAYGQTGSGKTYTMMGVKNKIPGLYLLAGYDIFSLLQNYNNLTIWVSFYEIYCGKLFDLLNERKVLTVREDGKQNICIVGLTEKNVNGLNDLMNIIEYGLINRIVGITGANADSSRSHGIIQIIIKDEKKVQYGKISFIDLAGSERAIDTIDTNKQTKFDGAEINKSLLALKECIRALDQEKKHTPFRGSKLTLVLRDSFIGSCKTLMIGNISPSLSSSEHTLNTLRYADRVKELRTKSQNFNISPIPLKATKNSRNNSKRNFNVAGNKSMNVSQKNNNLSNLTRLNCFKMKNKSKNKISSEKMKDKLNISDNNFFNNIPEIKTTKKIKTVVFRNNNENEKDTLKDENLIENHKFHFKNVTSSLLSDYSLKEKDNNESRGLYKEKDKEILVENNNSLKNNDNEKINRTKSGYVGFQFLKNYKNFKDRIEPKNRKKKVYFENTNEELEELKKRKKLLILNIKEEQKKCIEMHKTHIDHLVELMKKEMNFIDVVEEKLNINSYVEQMLKIFNLEILKIDKIKRNFVEFNSMIKEKEEIEKRIEKLSNAIQNINKDIDKDESTNCLSNINFNSDFSGMLSGSVNSQLCDYINDVNLSHSLMSEEPGNGY
jgi:kinesin family protein 2/24